MHEYVSHAPLSSPLGLEFWCPSFSSSTAHWTQWTFCCLHSPAPPIRSVSIYLSHTLTCSSILPPFLSLPLSLLLSLSISLQLPAVHLPFSRTRRSLVFLVFSFAQTFRPLSLWLCLCVCAYLCTSSLVQTQTVSNSARFRQARRGLSVGSPSVRKICGHKGGDGEKRGVRDGDAGEIKQGGALFQASCLN